MIITAMRAGQWFAKRFLIIFSEKVIAMPTSANIVIRKELGLKVSKQTIDAIVSAIEEMQICRSVSVDFTRSINVIVLMPSLRYQLRLVAFSKVLILGNCYLSGKDQSSDILDAFVYASAWARVSRLGHLITNENRSRVSLLCDRRADRYWRRRGQKGN